MSERKILVHSNDTAVSRETRELLVTKLEKSGFTAVDTLSEDVELVICIGGDGSFLEAVHKYNFPKVPFIGINTGHLGFFQEIHPSQLDEFIFHYKQGTYSLQKMSTVKAVVECEAGRKKFKGLNEIVIKSENSYTIHLNISIGGSFIERFSGDGLLVATAAGSTAYNYSLGGSIVDPRLELLQVTPIAPMNTTAYRSFTSSILLPAELTLGIIPEAGTEHISVAVDGREETLTGVKGISIGFSKRTVQLLRLEGYDFWNKVKTKFL